MTQNTLEIQNVSQSFMDGFWMKKKQILYDVTLKIPEKSISGFLGANGAGKTTLIHLIVGLKKPKSGQVKIAGLDIHSQNPTEIKKAKAKLGYLPERPYFYEHLTGAEFLTYLGTLSQMPSPLIKSRIPDVLKQVGMLDAKDKALKNYSKGMLQRIGIAQAILHDPEFLVFDEPMSGLDPVGRKEIRELMLDLAKKGHTIFFSTHVIPDAEVICDQVVMIQRGKIVGQGPLSQFLSNEGHRYEIGFASTQSGIAQDIASAMGTAHAVIKVPEGYRVQCDGEAQKELVLKKLAAAQATLLWLTPLRRSLESYFQDGRSS